jgi:flavodoxin
MWIVVGMASSRKIANRMQKALESEGVLVKITNVSNKIKSSDDTYEILVLESESDSARDILLENGL